MKVIYIALMFYFYILNGQNLQFSEYEHDFGVIREDGGKVQYEFSFENKSKSVIKIEDVKSQCGCTITEWSKTAVNPGGSGKLPVTFDPDGRSGKFIKKISVYTNTMTDPIALYIKGNILAGYSDFRGEIEGVKLSVNELSFSRIKNTDVTSDIIEFFNASDEKYRLEISSGNPNLTIDKQVFILNPKESGILSVSFDAGKSGRFGYWKDSLSVTLHFSGKSKKHIIPVSYIIEEDFSDYSLQDKKNAPKIVLPENEFLFGEEKKGSFMKKDFRIINKGKTDLLIRRIPPIKNIDIVDYPKVLKPGEEGLIKTRINFSTKTDLFLRSINIISNDPVSPTLFIKVKGRVK